MIYISTLLQRAITCRRVALSVFTLSLIVSIAPAQAQTAKLDPVRVSRVPIMDYVPTDFAMARGWFKDAGLDVTVGAVAGGAVSMQGLIANRLELIFTSLDAPIKARSQGFDVVIIASNNIVPLTPPDGSAVVTMKDSGIATLKQLEGKRVLVNNLNNVNWGYIREGVARSGGDPAKVQFLEVDFPHMVDSMLAGRADAAAVTEPFLTVALNTGKLAVLSYTFVEMQPGLNLAGWVARGDWVRSHPREIAAFRAVLQKSIDFLNKNPDEKTKAILQFTRVTEPLLKKITLSKWSTTPDVADLQKQIEVYKRNGMIDKEFNAKDLVAP